MLLIGQCVSTLSTCIDFCHIRIGSGPLGVCRDPLGRLFSLPSEAHILPTWALKQNLYGLDVSVTVAKASCTLSITWTHYQWHFSPQTFKGKIVKYDTFINTFTVNALIHMGAWHTCSPRQPANSFSVIQPDFICCKQTAWLTVMQLLQPSTSAPRTAPWNWASAFCRLITLLYLKQSFLYPSSRATTINRLAVNY